MHTVHTSYVVHVVYIGQKRVLMLCSQSTFQFTVAGAVKIAEVSVLIPFNTPVPMTTSDRTQLKNFTGCNKCDHVPDAFTAPAPFSALEPSPCPALWQLASPPKMVQYILLSGCACCIYKKVRGARAFRQFLQTSR